MSELEMCIDCDEPTGRAGPLDDSMYCSDEKCESGPLCETCEPKHNGCRVSDLATLREKLAEVERENTMLRDLSDCTMFERLKAAEAKGEDNAE